MTVFLKKSATEVIKHVAFLFAPFFLVACLFSWFSFLIRICERKGEALLATALSGKAQVREISISPLKGIEFKGVLLQEKNGLLFSAESIRPAAFSVDLKHHRILIKSFFVEKASIEVPKSEATFNSFGLLNSSSKILGPNVLICVDQLTVSIKSTDAHRYENILTFAPMCLSLNNSRVRIDGQFMGLAGPEPNPFKSLLKNKIPLVLDFDRLNSDIVVNQLRADFALTSVSMSGMIYHSDTKPFVDLQFNATPVRLDSIPFLRLFRPQGGDIGILGSLAGDKDSLKLKTEVLMPSAEFILEGEHIQLSHFTSNLAYDVARQELTLQDFRGTIDHAMEIAISGSARGLDNPSISLKINILPVVAKKDNNSQNSSAMALSGRIAQGKFLGALQISYGLPSDYWQASLKDFTLQRPALQHGRIFLSPKVAHIHVTQNTMVKGQKEKSHQFDFENAEGKIYLIGKKTIVDDLAMKGYEGTLRLKGYSHLKESGMEYFWALSGDHLIFDKLSLFYPLYCELSGGFNGTLILKNIETPVLMAYVEADNFKLAELEILDKIADFLGVDSLREIADTQVSMDFSLLPKTAVETKFDLDSPTLSMRSSFHFNKEQWLEGDVALSLPRSALEKSKIFKTLMAVAKERNDFLDFTVHISGSLEALRIELVKSDLRDKLKEKVSGRIQQFIESEANKALSHP